MVVECCGEDRTTKLAFPNPPGIGNDLDPELTAVLDGELAVALVDLVAVVGTEVDVVVVEVLALVFAVAFVLPPACVASPILTEIGPACTTADTDGITNTRALSWRGGGLEKFSVISDIACWACARK